MAMNYQNFASLGVNLNRQKYGPLDISNVFTSTADLKYYLTKGTFTDGVSEYWYKSATEKVVPYPYEGQVLATVIDGIVNVYALALDAEGNFTTQEIGAKVEADGKTIKLNDGKLELVGLPTDTAGKTYVPSYVNGVLTWAEPDTSTAEGQAQEIEGLKTRAKALEDTVNGTEEAEGLVEKVAALEAIDNATQAELDSYKTEVETAIGEALQAAKDYADAQDADTIYDDTDVKARIKAIEDDYLKEADKYDDTEVRGLISEVSTAVGTEKTRAEAAEANLLAKINAIDFIDSEELAEAIKDFTTKTYVDGEIDKIEEAIGNLNHFKAEVVDSIDKVTELGVLYLIKDESVVGVDKYNEYIVVDGAAVLIGDTTTDLSNYYNKTEIDGKVQTIEGAIADEVAARGALADKVAALEAVDNAIQAELDAYKTDVTEEIRVAKEAAIADADGKLAGKVDSSAFETFKGENTTAIATAKQEAIDAAKAAEEAKKYATEAELTEAVKGIENDLLSYAKTADVNAELAKKIETGSIAHSTDSIAEGVSVDGTQINIVVDAYTKAETLTKIQEKITEINGGESAGEVLSQLNSYKETNDARVGAIETKNGEQDTAIATAQAQADKGVADAAKVASDLAALDTRVVSNTNEIGVVKGSITTVNETLSSKIADLEAEDIELAGLISGLDTAVKDNSDAIGRYTASITALEAKDAELVGQINGVDAKFAGYYTKSEVDAAVQGAIDAIPDVDLEPYAKTEDVNAELAKKADASAVYTKDEADAAFMTQDEVDSRISALIDAANNEDTIKNLNDLVAYVNNNASDIAALVSEVEAHDAKFDGLGADQTVKGYVDDAIAAIVMPKASTEVTIAEDGTLGIGEVSTDKLVNGVDTFVIDGGDAAK